MKMLLIKEEQQLTQEQINYIRKFTLSPITFLYLLARRQYIPFLYFVVVDFMNFLVRRWFLSNWSSVSLIFYILTFILFNGVFFAYCFYARRISWNACEWKSFESFQKSEKTWNIATFVFLLVIAVLLLIVIFW